MEHKKIKKTEADREMDLALFENQKIVDINMEKEVRKSFIEYSMSVIIARALPDVRDGMKPGQRRILYAMYEDNLTHDNPFRKSATTVGNVLGRYHPHGDSAVYGTMVRMAQPFSYRYPLVEGHGNFGSVDGDPPAAYRYTEARLDKIADEMTRDIDKNGVNMVPNFDNSRVEPEVLPSRFPNFLVNGAVGIAVGMATNVPTHNLGEVIDATIYRMEHPDCSVDELMEFIKGPDFPTAGIIYGVNGIKEAYRTGQGRITVRARAEVDEEKRQIVITEIPYMVNKSMLCAAIGDLVKDKRIEGITDLRDESGRDGMRIVVDYRRDANGQIILNQLYKYSQLQDTCSVNMLAVVNGEPKVLNLSEVLDHYISFQDSVIRRRTQFDLDKALARAHILEGYVIAIQNIDEIVEIMKKSPSIPEAKLTLIDRFGLSDVQAQAIVDMTIGRLTGLETKKIEDELAKLEALIADLRAILADDSRVRGIIRDEMTAIRNKYADPRRTEIVQAADDILLEDLIERHNCVITMTHSGYIKRLPADTYASQHRGGKGIIGMATKDEDFIERVIAMCSHDYLMMFTNTGKVHTRKAFMIPEASRTAKGQNLVNILQLTPDEKVTAVIGVPGFDETAFLTMVTKNGVIKRTALSDFEYQRKGGKIAINLDEGDELVFVMCTHGEKDVILATRNGLATRFSESDVRVMGRTARGVRGIRLRDGDYVTGVAAVEDGKMLVTVTENGYGKRTAFDDFRLMKNRGGMGVTCHNINDKTGKLAGIAAVSDDEDLMFITDSGVIVRTPVNGINRYSRTASGVICMRLGEGQKLIGFTTVPREEEEESPAEESSAGAENSFEEGAPGSGEDGSASPADVSAEDVAPEDDSAEDVSAEEVSADEEDADTSEENK